MRRGASDALVLGGLGLGVGVALGMLAASAYATWAVGGDLRQVELTTILDHIGSSAALLREPTRTATLAGAVVALACAAAAVALGYRRQIDSHGSARWACEAELVRADMARRVGQVVGPIFGKLGSPRSRARFLTTDAWPHSLVAAPTGSGKGVGVVIPTLLTYPGSVVCLDMKGENFLKTARRRAALGDRVFKFAPYDDEDRTHRFNPLALVAETRERRRFTEARRLAASLIVARSRSAEGFIEGAREIFAATAMLAVQRGEPTIAAVYDLLTRPGPMDEAFAAMSEEAWSEEARTVFNRMAGMEGRVLSSYLSVLLDGGLGIWADPAVRAATAASDFSIETLRREPATIYIVVSPNDLAPLAPLVRLIFEQSIAHLQRAEPSEEERFPVLFLLDEFGSLGRMEALSNGITTLRSFGGRVMIVVQSIAHLRQNYGPDGATHFLANCGLQLFMAPSDGETPVYVSKAIGDYTRKARSKSWRQGEAKGPTLQERLEGAALIRPEALRRLGDDTTVVLAQGRDPAKVRKVRYYEDRELWPIFEGQSGPLPEPPPLPNLLSAATGILKRAAPANEAVEGGRETSTTITSETPKAGPNSEDAARKDESSPLSPVSEKLAASTGPRRIRRKPAPAVMRASPDERTALEAGRNILDQQQGWLASVAKVREAVSKEA
jgi:type IV secretion system protein VirD4